MGITSIATEYVDGESLRQRIARVPLQLSEVLEVAQQIVELLPRLLISPSYWGADS
jgi:hypothetical protein